MTLTAQSLFIIVERKCKYPHGSDYQIAPDYGYENTIMIVQQRWRSLKSTIPANIVIDKYTYSKL